MWTLDRDDSGELVDRLRAHTDEFRDRSETVCEWCGSAGRLRHRRSWELTLCDDCDGRFPDPPYELRGTQPKRSS